MTATNRKYSIEKPTNRTSRSIRNRIAEVRLSVFISMSGRMGLLRCPTRNILAEKFLTETFLIEGVVYPE